MLKYDKINVSKCIDINKTDDIDINKMLTKVKNVDSYGHKKQ